MFPIVIVPADAAELSEQMGAEFKFWYSDDLRQRTLFKEGRPGTGGKVTRAATLDRLRHGAYELVLDGESYRAVPPSSEESKPPIEKERKLPAK